MSLLDKIQQLNLRTLDTRVRAALFTVFSIGLTNVLKMGVTFLSIPLIIGYLGTSMYGLITTIMTIGIWLTTVVDGGMGLGLKNAILKIRAHEATNDTAIKELASSTFFPMLLLVTLICLALSVIIPWLNWTKILNLQINISSTQLCIFILTILWSTLLFIPFTLPRLIYSAYQKEYLFAPWLMLGSLLGITLQIIFIKTHCSFIFAGSALQIGNLAGGIFGTLFFMYHMKAVRFNFRIIRWDTFKSLLSPSADFFILQLMALAIFQSGIFITNYLLGQQQAAIYALHFQIFAYFQMVVTLIISPFWSLLAETYHKKEMRLFKKTLLSLGSFIFLLSLGFAGTVIYFGTTIISLLSHSRIHYNPELLALIATYHVISITIGVLSLTLLSIGDTKSMRKIVIIQGLLNIVLSVIFVKYYGIIGCALGSLISIVLTIMWYSPLRLSHILNISVKGI